MSQIRETIELLTKILFDNGTAKVKAEVFRMAKFNGVEAVEPLWKLLFELISFCKFGKIDELTARACNDLSPEELAAFVKCEFQSVGYFSPHFAALPIDMSDGSRELLLALGWILSQAQIIEKFMMTCTDPLDDDTLSLHYEESASTSSCYSEQTGTKQVVADNVLPWQRVEKLLAFNNKLQMSLRSLYSLQCERHSLKHKVQEATNGVSSPGSSIQHLSMLEVYLIRHPDLLRKHIDLLERDNGRLRNLIRWRELEGTFWKWMESVLEAKQVAAAAAADAAAESIDCGSADNVLVWNIVESDFEERLESNRQNLQQAILKYESIVEHLERLCMEKIEAVSSEDIDNVVQSISRELTVQKARLSTQFVFDQQQQQQQYSDVEPRFVLDSWKRQQTRKNISSMQTNNFTSSSSVDQSSTDQEQDGSVASECPESVNSSALSSRDIEQEIALLRRTAGSLGDEVDAMRSNYEERLRLLATERLHNAVCIPPLDPRGLVARHRAGNV